ncbi:MAG: small multi-drug export protein [Candidatus Electryonea clarkiae]|nr:small multi-drug export protein [Candidatus Electryonea clarkiae]MDP8285586.1 small multi-drug export protein [Candidatus Electryonea clarkiae]
MEIAGKIASYFQGSPAELITVIIAMLPVAELRGAIPWALTLGDLDWTRAIPLAIVGNMIPIPFILLLLGPVSNFLSRWAVFEKFFQWLFARTRKRSKNIERYKALGLILFVAIPLPVTGGWTGSVAAFLFGIRFWKAMICVFIGVCIAAVIVSLTTLGAIGAVRLFG